ncbi:MAG: stage II sporulation protein R [Eubacteriales bacterium]|nr:stage II sporulation protein R [Eubacteriales bacterium]MDD3073956.1 stage II sporulation protein R [Eubacteriales bacterium]MDD4079402.1 stage II sporulation protein R [Eubacteriales bacterium]
MKENTGLACTIFLLLLLFAQGTALAQGDVIRLHVIANSNSVADQRLKEEVRDKIVTELGPVFAGMEQRDVAAWIIANQSILVNLASSVLTAAGEECLVQVKFQVEDYPVRAYQARTYPEGKYRSVQVILGEGQGRNWWCLLFPPLCFVNETMTEGACGEQEIEVRFWLWEKVSVLIQGLFSGSE